MTFFEAVKTCFTKYASFEGRATRSEYWWFALFVFIAGLVFSVISDRLGQAFYVATLLPSISAAARRLHDTNRSGWWQLVMFVPVIGWIFLVILLALRPRDEGNRFGPAPGQTSLS